MKNNLKIALFILTIIAVIGAAIGLAIWDSTPGGIPEGFQCLMMLGGFGIALSAWLTAGD